jgi:hypothetical protein
VKFTQEKKKSRKVRNTRSGSGRKWTTGNTSREIRNGNRNEKEKGYAGY